MDIVWSEFLKALERSRFEMALLGVRPNPNIVPDHGDLPVTTYRILLPIDELPGIAVGDTVRLPGIFEATQVQLLVTERIFGRSDVLGCKWLL
jgi:hypothetical protein